MTCVVGIIKAGTVFIGADSCSSNCSYASIYKNPKVFRRGELLFGFTTSWRMGQLLEHNLSVPSRPEGITDLAYLIAHLVPAMRSCFKEGGFAEIKNAQESGGTFLIGYRGSLYEVDSDFQVGQWVNEYAAVGSGMYVALGSLHATSAFDPEERIKLALQAATDHTPYVRPPFTIMQQPEKGPTP